MQQLEQQNAQLRQQLQEMERTQLVNLLRGVATAANEAPNFATAVESCLFQIGNFTGWPIGHCYMFDGMQSSFFSTQIWYCEDQSAFDDLYTITQNEMVPVTDPWLGAVWVSGGALILPDIDSSVMFARRDACLKAGLRMGYAFPILVENHPVGIMEFYAYSAVQLEKQFHEVMNDVGKQIGLVFAREQAAELLREQKERAEAANIAKSEFLANMSHELRTPMNGIIGLSQLMKDMPLQTEAKECVDAVFSSATGLLGLLNDILDFSKIEAGELTLEAHPFLLKAVVEDVVEMLQPLAAAKGVQFESYFHMEADTILLADSVRLRQIFINLLGNAIKFTEEGFVTLTVEPLEQQAEGGALAFRVVVADSGIGIPAEKLPFIFHKFSQGDSSMTRKYGGTGLGLSITQQLVQLMAGQIMVESAVGEGSTFIVHLALPVAQSLDNGSEVEHIRRSKATLKAADAHVLVVDDHPVNRMFAGKLLQKFGVQNITYAENGKEALAALEQTGFDLLLLDCQMPEMDGFETISCIRAQEQETAQHVPVVAMTAHAMKGDRERCLKLGMDDYISKPINLASFQNAVGRWIKLVPPSKEGGQLKAQPHSQPQSEQPAVDLEHLRLFTEGDKEQEQVIFELFVETGQQSIDTLAIALMGTKTSDWKQAVHRLKGAAGNIGAVKLHELCTQAEHWDLKKDIETATVCFEDIQLQFEAVKSFFKKLLRETA